MTIYDKILGKKAPVAIIGLGYVGLPIALEFAKKVNVIGFDINPSRIDLLKQGCDPSGEIPSSEFNNCSIEFTCDIEALKEAVFFIVAVPTPIDAHNMPDLSALKGASKTVGKALKKGDYVVFESTVYPGCTEEDCLPILEKESGLKGVTDFKIGYSPERINPGDKEHTLSKIMKVVAGCDTESLDIISKTYEIVVKAGTHKASSIKVAEAAKVIENTQRDLNIALMNELSIIFDKLSINTNEVLEAAGTKWNFIKFNPGLVGGHCIGVDPYYLTYKAQELGYTPSVILSGRKINDQMGAYVAKKTIQLMISRGIHMQNAKILVLGTTFKENVKDIRNSKVVNLVNELLSFGVQVDIIDPLASYEEFKHEYGLELSKKPNGTYDAIVMAVYHDQFKQLDFTYFNKLSKGNLVFIDIKGHCKGKVNDAFYWSL